MKLTFPTFKKSTTPAAPKKFRVDARRYWVLLLSAFVLALAAELLFFSLAFRRETARLEAPATPTLETNESKIRHMQAKLDAVDAAIKARTGTTAAAQSN